MTNNFQIISVFLKWLGFDNMSDNDTFVNIQIMQRKKDGHEKTRIIKTYLIRSLDDFWKREYEIIMMCDAFKARAYINVNPKTERAVQGEMMKKLVELMTECHTMDPIRLTTHAIGTCKCLDNFWIVDIDKEDLDFVDEITDEINTIYNHYRNEPGTCVLLTVPTKCGVHLITHPFNLTLFGSTYPQIDVKKNNPTILYIPDSI